MSSRVSSSLSSRLAAPIRAVAYLRVSTDQQTERYGLASQRLACQLYVRERGYHLFMRYGSCNC